MRPDGLYNSGDWTDCSEQRYSVKQGISNGSKKKEMQISSLRTEEPGEHQFQRRVHNNCVRNCPKAHEKKNG